MTQELHTELTISDAARVLSLIDTEIQELESDMRALGRQKSDIERREIELTSNLDTLRKLALGLLCSGLIVHET
jgi:prefoldin subunit 5